MLVYTLICSYIHFFRASWYGGTAFWNIFSSDDMFDNLLLMLSGMFLIMFGW